MDLGLPLLAVKSTHVIKASSKPAWMKSPNWYLSTALNSTKSMVPLFFPFFYKWYCLFPWITSNIFMFALPIYECAPVEE